MNTISRRQFLTGLGAGATLAWSPRPLLGVEPPPASKPNIIFILADDLGWGSVGCYGAPPALITTPNLDRLAKEGRRFTDANTPSSVCSPTRYGVLAGRYCWRTSLKAGVLGNAAPLHIETDRLTVASMLKTCGYATAAVGKWHLGYGPKQPTNYTERINPGPLDIGFDYHLNVAREAVIFG